jgi:hypothetical protein
MLEPVVRVPDVVFGELQGEPRVGTAAEQAYVFLTTDAAGAPHVCLLSRAQLDADTDAVRAVVYSSGTKANLERRGLACLVVIAGGAAHYCTLAVRRQMVAGRLTGYAMELTSYRCDEVPGAQLQGMRYRVTEQMPKDEDWATTRRMLGDLVG